VAAALDDLAGLDHRRSGVDGHNCGQRARQAHIDGELRLAQNLGGGIDANSSLALDNPVYRSTPLAARLRALASFSAIVAIDSTPLSLTSRGFRLIATVAHPHQIRVMRSHPGSPDHC